MRWRLAFYNDDWHLRGLRTKGDRTIPSVPLPDRAAAAGV
jgi:hypothetical protein